MPRLTSQRSLRSVQKLGFCYLCGEYFEHDSERTKDHVPPQSIFAESDRNFPLILDTHGTCNRAQSQEDEVIGQLVSLLHGRAPKPHRLRLNIEIRPHTDEHHELGVLTGLNVEAVIRRWLKGFHAALYQQPLADGTRFATHAPFPSGTITGNGVAPDPIPEQHRVFVEELRRNRLTGSIDTIVCNNGRMRYECVWVRMDDDGWGCIYGIDLYGWKNLGDIQNFPPRACVGLYRRQDAHFPQDATCSTEIEFPVENGDALDPFAS